MRLDLYPQVGEDDGSEHSSVLSYRADDKVRKEDARTGPALGVCPITDNASQRLDSMTAKEPLPLPLPSQDGLKAATLPQHLSSTERHLIYLTRVIVDLLNSRSFTDPFFKKHMSPTLFTDYGDHSISSREAFLANFESLVNASLDFQTIIINESVVVDEWKGVGEVLISKDATGFLRSGRRKAGAMMFLWKRKWDVWICEGQQIISGSAELLF